MSDSEDEFTLADLKKVKSTIPAITENSLMTFGKYKGKKICNVPASYLLWWADTSPERHLELLEYILENREDLIAQAQEHKYSDHYEGYDDNYGNEENF